MDNATLPNLIEVFLGEVERRLRRHVPASNLQAILTEARSHLEQRAADFIAGGMSEADAAYASVAAFGKPGAWAREIIDAQYADAGTAIASRIALIGALLAISAYLLINCRSLLLMWGGAALFDRPAFSVCVIVLIASLMTLGLASFRARQPQLLLMIGFGFVTTVALFASYASMAVTVEDFDAPYARREIPNIISSYKIVAREPSQEYKLLKLGHLIFREARTHPGMAIPAELRSGDRYIVPLPDSEQTNGAILWMSAFKKPIAYDPSNPVLSRSLEDRREQLKAAAPYRTVATVPEAVAAWDRDSRGYLIQYSVTIQTCKREIDNLHTALARSPRFDRDAGWYGARIALVGFGGLIVFHYLAAFLGRRLFQRHLRKVAAAT